MKPHYLTYLVLVLVGCQTVSEKKIVKVPSEIAVSSPNKILSFMGDELPPKTLPTETEKLYVKNLEDALQKISEDPNNEENIIWHGRRLAYLGRYQEAIDVYTDGLSKFPNSYRLRRHRGHRYITTRQIDAAIKDFELAAFYSRGAENEIEPDGIPNRLNVPIGNDKYNIWYHFGLAHYINGRFDKAVSAYEKTMEFSKNDDQLMATSYWLYLSAKRIGNDELAEEVLSRVSRSMQMIGHEDYFILLLLYKGLKTPEEVLKEAENEEGQLNPTLAYGLGNWYLQNSQVDMARGVFWRTLESPDWDTFGYIATEADIQNMATSVD